MPALPPPVRDEREALLAFLDHQRCLVRTAAHGLTESEARATPTASALSIGGLVKHLAAVERGWMGRILQRESSGDAAARAQRYFEQFQLDDSETLAGVLDDYAAAAAETAALVATIADLGQPVPVPHDAPWFPVDVDAWSVRWVLLHLIEEVARHTGHADIVRESIDGASSVELLAAIEQWPASDWVRPWTPAPHDPADRLASSSA